VSCGSQLIIKFLLNLKDDNGKRNAQLWAATSADVMPVMQAMNEMCKLESPDDTTAAIRSHLATLPLANQATLKVICSLLCEVIEPQHYFSNKMQPDSLAMCTFPLIREPMTHMILNYPAVFDGIGCQTVTAGLMRRTTMEAPDQMELLQPLIQYAPNQVSDARGESKGRLSDQGAGCPI
jgi:hypothetical protein